MGCIENLKAIYPNDWATIVVGLGNAISDDNPSNIKQIIQKYLLKPETKFLLDGEIALEPSVERGSAAYLAVPAHFAVSTSNRNALETILEFTKNPNSRACPDTPLGSMTLLMVAAKLGDIKTVELLLNHGADPNAKTILTNGLETTALCEATIGGFSEIVDLLIERNSLVTFGSALLAMESERSLSPFFVRFVTINPSLIYEKHIPFTGITLLHHAAGGGFLETVKWLISMGADINAADKNGGTPISYALRFENDVIAEYLLANGGLADITINASQNPSIQIESSKKIEVTQLIERLELLEEKMGISISGLYASIEQRSWASPPNFLLRLNFDIVTVGGAALENSFYLRAAAYNEAGQAIGKDETFIYNKEFLGFDSRAIEMAVDQKPARIRLFPAK